MSHPPFHDPDHYPRLQIRLYLAPDVWIGPGKADLLELIAATGSISEAGRRMGMSYKRAWSLVETLNSTFAAPLVARVRGGAGGGGARLTPMGEQVLAHFRRIMAEAGAAVEDSRAALMALRAGPGASGDA
ncbi:MAG: LysR family transcriptional regulator [Paracoccus sp. (in: a-proteobacteria)]|nr:LysR family transcriptional regulator [Paracoccus sp. (in: a-proteobacteria)]